MISSGVYVFIASSRCSMQVALLAVDDVLLELLLDRQVVVLAVLRFGGRPSPVVGEQADEVRERIESLARVGRRSDPAPRSTAPRGMRFCGRILLACTIAPVSPASRSSCRNALFSTTRAAGFRPKLTFESPTTV